MVATFTAAAATTAATLSPTPTTDKSDLNRAGAAGGVRGKRRGNRRGNGNQDGRSGSSSSRLNEADIYDRQIRLWGAESQAKMSQAKVLYIHVTGVSSEILKNLVLAGVKAVLMDNRPYPQAVRETPSFFLAQQQPEPVWLFTESREGGDSILGVADTEKSDNNADREPPAAKKLKTMTVAQVVKTAVEELNPVLGSCDTIGAPTTQALPDSFFTQFSAVVCSRMTDLSEVIRIRRAVTAGGGYFFMADCFGMLQGACLIDVGPNHMYRPEKGKEFLEPTPVREYVDLETALQQPLSAAVNRFHKSPPPTWIAYRCLLEYISKTKEWPVATQASKFVQVVQEWLAQDDNNNNKVDREGSGRVVPEDPLLRADGAALYELAKTACCEIAPVCSVLGGLVGNEIIKVLSGKGEPANNTLLFDGLACKAWTFLVKPPTGVTNATPAPAPPTTTNTTTETSTESKES